MEWLTPVGLVRGGQQPSHWGMGIVANDGDHPSLFGDYRYGNIVEQVLFATKPFGVKSPFVVALAGNLVYRDNVAILTNGDRALQGILAAFYEQGPDMLGVYGVYRDQSHAQQSGANFLYSDNIHVGVIDLAGHFARPIAVPNETAYVFGAFEAATELGATDEERTVYQLPGGPWTKIQAYGGSATLGVVLAGHEGKKPESGAMASRPDLYGHVVAQVEVGYASGDANPDDTTEKRFVFNPTTRWGCSSSTRSCGGRRRARRRRRPIRNSRTVSAPTLAWASCPRTAASSARSTSTPRRFTARGPGWT